MTIFLNIATEPKQLELGQNGKQPDVMHWVFKCMIGLKGKDMLGGRSQIVGFSLVVVFHCEGSATKWPPNPSSW